MLNRENAMKMFEPYIRANEIERAKQQRQGMLDSYSSAQTPQAQYDALFGGLIRGDIDKDILSSWSDMYKYNNPHLQAGSVNTGDKITMTRFNPATGEVDILGSFPVGMNPYQKATIGINQADLEDRRKWHNDELELKRAEFMSKQQKEYYEWLDAEEKSIAAQIVDLQERMQMADDSDNGLTKKAITQRIENLQSQLQNIRNERTAIRQSYLPSYGQKTVSQGVYRYSDLINKYATQFGIEPELIMAIMQAESGGDPNMSGNGTTVSPAGARGVMQLIPDTAKEVAKELGLDPNKINIDDPETSIMLGTALAKKLSDKYGGNIEKIAWAYNAGAGATDKGRLPKETQNYIPKVVSTYQQLKKSKQQQSQQPAQSTQKAQEQPKKEKQTVIWRNPKTGEELTQERYDTLFRAEKETHKDKLVYTKADFDKMLHDKGFENVVYDAFTSIPYGLRDFGSEYVYSYPAKQPLSNNAQKTKSSNNNNQDDPLSTPLTLSDDVGVPNVSVVGGDIAQNYVLTPPTVVTTLSENSPKQQPEETSIRPIIIPSDDGTDRTINNYVDEDTRYRTSAWGNMKTLGNELNSFVNQHRQPGHQEEYTRPSERQGNETRYITNTPQFIADTLSSAADTISSLVEQYPPSKNTPQMFTPQHERNGEITFADVVNFAKQYTPQGIPSSSLLHDRTQEGEEYPQRPVTADNPIMFVDTSSFDPLMPENEKLYDWHNVILRQAEFERSMNNPFHWQRQTAPYILGNTNENNSIATYSPHIPLSDDILLNSYDGKQNITPSYMSGNINLLPVYPAIDILEGRLNEPTSLQKMQEINREKYYWDMLRGKYSTWEEALQQALYPNLYPKYPVPLIR